MTNSLWSGRLPMLALFAFILLLNEYVLAETPPPQNKTNEQVFEPHHGRQSPPAVPIKKSLKPIPSTLHKVIVQKNNKVVIGKLDETKARRIDYAGSYLYILSDKDLGGIPADIRKTLQINNEHNMLYLNSGKTDTSRILPEIDAGMKSRPLANNEKQLYILQFSGPVLSTWRDQLSNDFGVEVVDAIPKNAYLIWINANQLVRLKKNNAFISLVQLITPYHPAYRVSTSLQAITEPGITVNLRFYRHKNIEKILQTAIGKATKVIHQPYTQGKYTLARIEIAPAEINEIARLPGLVTIERYYPKSVGGERQGRILSNQIVQNGTALACNPTGGTVCVANGPGYLSWFNSMFPGASGGTDFQSFLIHYADTGIDRGDTAAINLHPDFLFEGAGASRLVSAGRLAGVTATSTTADALDTYGHGTMVASVISGYANDTTVGATSKQDASGYDFGVGMVPYARIASTRIFDCCTAGSLIDLNPNIPMLYENAYDANSRISSNSWGDVGTATPSLYTTESQQIDLAVRDAKPGTAQNQEMTIVFLAGNDGYYSSDSMYHGRTLVNAGATSKNTIVVGASENTNPDFSGCMSGIGIDVSNPFSNDTRDTAFFTSRGPTSVASGSRNKPDLVAPGTRIQAGVPQSGYPAAGAVYCPGSGFYPTAPVQTEYHRERGTSFSTPAVAGAVAMLKQTFINRKTADTNGIYANMDTNVATPSPSPSPALNKAWLMNTTTYLTRPGYDVISGTTPWPGEIVGGENLPSPVQGMGLLNIERALDTTPRVFRDQSPVSRRFTDPLQSYSYSGVINPAIDFRATLAWTDANSAVGALLNDLNLVVTLHRAGPDIVYNGNHYTGAVSNTCPPDCTTDNNNNVESVWIPAANLMAGDTFTVTVSSASISADGFPNELDYDPTLNGGLNDPTDQDFALVIYNATIPSQDDVLAITDDGPHPDINAMLTANDVTAYTSAGDPLTITGIDTTGIDPRVTVNFAGGLVSYQVSNSVAATDAFATSFTYTVTDGYGATGTAMATLNVTGTNQVPSAPGGLSISVSEDDAPFPFDLLTGATDPDTGDILNVSGAMSTGDASGVVLAGNQLNVTPNSYNSLAQNVAEVVNYNYMLNDGHGGLTPQTAMVTITGVNDAPVAAGDLTAAVNEGETVVLTDTDLTASDPESAPTGLTYTLTALPANGTVNLSGVPLVMGGTFTQQNINDGLVSYTHNSSETTTDNFMLTLGDDDAMSPIVLPAMLFNITITLNDAPVVQLDTNPTPALNYTGNFDLGTGTAVAISDAATIADTENDAIQQLTVSITNLLDGTNESLSLDGLPAPGGTTASHIDYSYNNSTGVLTLTPQISFTPSIAEFSAALNLVRYNNSASTPDATSRVIESIVTETSDSSATATSTINFLRRPLDMAIVLDTSGSMNTVSSTSTRLQLMKDAMDLFLNAFDGYDRPEDRLGVLYYSNAVSPVALSLQNFAPNWAAINTDISMQAASGWTAMGAGLQSGIEGLLAAPADVLVPNHRSVTVLLTDGQQNRSPMLMRPGTEYMSGGTLPTLDPVAHYQIHNATTGALVDDAFAVTGDSGIPEASPRFVLGNPVITDPASVTALNNSVFTIGLGVASGSNLGDMLEKLADDTGAQVSSGTGSSLVTMPSELTMADSFIDMLVASLDETSLNLAGKADGNILANTKKEHVFTLNPATSKASFIVSWTPLRQKNALIFSLVAPDGQLIAVGSRGIDIRNKDFYTMVHLNFPLITSTGKIAPGGKWKMLISETFSQDDVNTTQSLDYAAWALENENVIKERVRPGKPRYGVGEKILVTASIRHLGKAAKDLAVQARVNYPRIGLGTFLARNKVPVKHTTTLATTDSATTSPDALDAPSLPVDKKLAYLLAQPELANKLVPQSKNITLVDDGTNGDLKANDGIYSASFSDTRLPGSYEFNIDVTGKLDSGADFSRRLRTRTATVIDKIDPGKTRISITRSGKADGNTRVSFVPSDTFDNLLGPGKTHLVSVKAKNAKLVGTLVDNLDGSYHQDLQVDSLFGADVTLELPGTTITTSTGISQKLYWLLLLLVALVIIAVYFYLRKKNN